MGPRTSGSRRRRQGGSPAPSPIPLLLRLNGYSALYLVFACWLIYALSFLVRAKRNIPRAVISLIAGISLLDGMLIGRATDEPLWAGVTVAAFMLTLILQRYVPGT